MKSMTLDYTKLEFNINRTGGFTFPLAMSIWKTQYKTFDNFERTLRGNYDGTEFNDYFDVVRAAWDDAAVLTVEQAFTTKNIEHRRVIFNAIGVENLMASLKPTLVDRQTITRDNLVFDKDGKSRTETLVDTYELYQIDGERLFEGTEAAERWRFQRDRNIYAVKCKDASTDREYWIYVTDEAARGKDALEAIAWTYMLKSGTKTNEVYRQGEVIIAKHGNTEEPNHWGRVYHMNKEEYLTKIKAQS
jgi:hypothetical protein